ncbi:MAG: MerR family transcriptional regulator [Sneathiella sp.]
MSDVENSPAPKVQKSPDAFRTISEVAEELDVPQHVLRFWETKFPVVKPLKRGGGRRYYRPADVDLIRGIRDLLYTHGFTIKGAQKLLKEQGGKIENIENLNSTNGLSPQSAAPMAAIARAQELAPNTSVADTYRNELVTVLQELKELRKLLP